MKIFKRNQIIILVMSFMLITAGYLNYKNNDENKLTSEIIGELGDATLVSSNLVEIENTTIIENTELNPIEESSSELLNETSDGEVDETVAIEAEDKSAYFVNSKLERSNMYSETLETYQKIYNDTSSSAEQKAEAIQKIAEINSQRNALMIAENLIQTKGIKNVVIFINGNSISAIVEAKELEQEQIAQIQNIISREINVSIENIHISTI